MASIFSSVGRSKWKSSNFNLSEEMKLSCNMGDLIPILCKEVLPGDKFKISTELLIKLAPLKAPVMHRLTAYVHYFFVPTFQINSVFERFINPKINDGSIVNPYIEPYILKGYGSKDGSMIGTLADYLGLPVTQDSWLNTPYMADGAEVINIDPFRVYQHIYNSYYRDQNLEPMENVDPSTTSLCLIDKGLDVQGNAWQSGIFDNDNQMRNLLTLRRRAWAKDYFTSALPSPQAGDDVLIPISSQVQADGDFLLSNDGVPPQNGALNAMVDEASQASGNGWMTDAANNPLQYAGGLKAVNSTATINDLRKAIALQRFKELSERGGTRYSEMVRNFFGAFLKDYWVDRPIFLGGQKQPIKISELFQTSMTSGTEALGERAGVAQSYGRTKGVSLNAPCHGYVMGILSIRPEGTYQQGLERMWTRKSLFDYAFPQFANMGEQEIYQKELFVTADNAENNKIFGYTPRYAEYKTSHCHVAGEFRTSLAYWHFGRIFDNAPTLSKEFVMMNSVPTRPFAILDSATEHVYVDLYNSIYARRRLPYFGTPSIL